MKFSMMGLENGDLIEVTIWAGLAVFLLKNIARKPSLYLLLEQSQKHIIALI